MNILRVYSVSLEYQDKTLDWTKVENEHYVARNVEQALEFVRENYKSKTFVNVIKCDVMSLEALCIKKKL